MNYHISFILPIYNVEAYLADAIESILKQTVSKEIILVDDGSTDSSLTIALTYAKQYPFISVIHSQNKGVSAARNAGLRLAQGEYVIFLDPDDILHDNIHLELIYQFAQRNNINVLKGQYQKQIGDKIYNCLPVSKDFSQHDAIALPLETFFAKSLPDDWFIHISCFLLKRSYLINEKLQFDESLRFSEDTLFNVVLFSSQNTIVEVPYIFFVYRVRENSAMTRAINLERLNSQKQMIEQLIHRLNTNTLYAAQIRSVIALNCSHFMQTIAQAPEYHYLITSEIAAFTH